MENEFARTELLIGSEGLARLRAASVMVLGVGGVGSHCIEALARSGVGKLIFISAGWIRAACIYNNCYKGSLYKSTVLCYAFLL